MLKGTVLWYDLKYKRGIIVDSKKNEYYVDISVIKNRIDLKRGQQVTFNMNHKIKDCLCACDVSLVE